MSDSIGTGLLVVLGIIAGLGLIATAGALYVIVKYRLPLRGIVTTLAGLAYVISPVDAVPEVPLGPVGLVDDIAVIIAAMMYIRRLVESRRTELR